MQLILWFSLAVAACMADDEAWQINRPPHHEFSYGEGEYNYFPKDGELEDSIPAHHGYLRMLHHSPTHMVIGGRDFVVSVEYSSLSAVGKIVWHASATAVNQCTSKGMSKELCGNFITMAQPFTGQEEHVLVCGTFAGSPRCSNFTRQSATEYIEGDVLPASSAMTPYFPTFRSSYVFNGEDLFTAVRNGFSGTTPLLYSYRYKLKQRTSQREYLNAPKFIKTVHHNGFVYFFFSEVPVQGVGKTRLKARVIRICENDTGVNGLFSTLLKADLSCYSPGKDHFYFDELKSVAVTYNSSLGMGRALVYGVFTTSPNSAPGSAVCAYFLDDIDRVMDHALVRTADGDYKYGDCTGSEFLDKRSSVYYSDPHIKNVEVVPSLLSESGEPDPLVYRTTFGDLFSHVTILPVDATDEGFKMDVIFVGTEGRRIIKAVIGASSTKTTSASLLSTVSIATLPPSGGDMVELAVSGDGHRLLVLRSRQLQAFPTASCSVARECGACVAMRDPHCGWLNHGRRGCVDVRSVHDQEAVLQGVIDGVHSNCPRSKQVSVKNSSVSSSPLVPRVAKSISAEDGYHTYYLPLLIALPCAGLLVGFLLGCVCLQLLTHYRVCRASSSHVTGSSSCSCWPRFWLPAIEPLADKRKAKSQNSLQKMIVEDEFSIYVDTAHRPNPAKSVNVMSNGTLNDYNSINVNINNTDGTTQKVRKMYL